MHTQTITYQSGDRALDAYFALPDADAPVPGILIIHEAWGLNENIRDISRRFADQGYAALAVDLFSKRSRVICLFRLFAEMALNSLEHQGIQDLKAGLTFLGAQPGVDANRLGAVGYCLGGGLAIALACTDSRLRAIAPYYGTNPRPLEAVRRSCPVVGSYPTGDFTTGAGEALDMELDKHGIVHDIKIYPGARHSFFNDRSSITYNPDAAVDSWERVLAFFEEHIRQASIAC